jgi:hypothetical protein
VKIMIWICFYNVLDKEEAPASAAKLSEGHKILCEVGYKIIYIILIYIFNLICLFENIWFKLYFLEYVCSKDLKIRLL